MPYGIAMLLPFATITIAFCLTFHSLGSCDLIQTEWSINCSSSLSTCTYLTKLRVGLLAKETIVAASAMKSENNNTRVEIEKVCRWYTREEKDWLQQSSIIWNGSTICLMTCLGFGLFGVVTLIVASSRECHPYLLRVLSVFLMINTLLCLVPMLIFLQADVCKEDDGVCDPSFTNCVSWCEMGMTTYYLFGACFLWLAASMTVWFLTPVRVRLHLLQHRQKENQRRRAILAVLQEGDDKNDEDEDYRDDNGDRDGTIKYDEFRSDVEDNLRDGAEKTMGSRVEQEYTIDLKCSHK